MPTEFDTYCKNTPKKGKIKTIKSKNKTERNGNVIGGVTYNLDDENQPVVQSAVPSESEENTENIQTVEEQILEEQNVEKQEELTQESVDAEESSEIQEEDSQTKENDSEDEQESESDDNELNNNTISKNE